MPWYILPAPPVGNVYPFSFDMDTPTENTFGIFKVLSFKKMNTLHITYGTVLGGGMGGNGILYVGIMKNIPSSLAELQASSAYRSYDAGAVTVTSTYTIPESVKDGTEYYLIICVDRVYWWQSGTPFPYRGRVVTNAYIN